MAEAGHCRYIETANTGDFVACPKKAKPDDVYCEGHREHAEWRVRVSRHRDSVVKRFTDGQISSDQMMEELARPVE